MAWKNKNFGKSPQDPDYLEGYDAESDYEAYCEALEEREQQKREE